MAIQSPRSLRTASVGGISFNLPKFHRTLAETIGVGCTDPGVPGGGGLAVLSESSEVALTTYLVAELLTKYDDGVANPKKIVNTWERFHEAERLCFDTNQRLAVSGLRGPYERELNLARKLAAKILGPFDWDAAAEHFGWGPGASTRRPRRESDAAYKYTGNPETTAGNSVLAHAAICHVPSWRQELDYCEEGIGYCKIVTGNRVVTVPKNWKTDRTIAIEPDMNICSERNRSTDA
jgi:hypothetical protein